MSNSSFDVISSDTIEYLSRPGGVLMMQMVEEKLPALRLIPVEEKDEPRTPGENGSHSRRGVIR